ncbi:hypothetical protein VTN96DRAFT_1510 [Rasamsonia emersonii]
MILEYIMPSPTGLGTADPLSYQVICLPDRFPETAELLQVLVESPPIALQQVPQPFIVLAKTRCSFSNASETWPAGQGIEQGFQLDLSTSQMMLVVLLVAP